jgi:hypothetical protein
MDVDVLGNITLGNVNNGSATSIDFDHLYGNVAMGGDLIVNIDNVAWSAGLDAQDATFDGAGNVFVYTDINDYGSASNGPEMVFTTIDLTGFQGNFHLNFGDSDNSDKDRDVTVDTGNTVSAGNIDTQYTTIIDWDDFDMSAYTISFAGLDDGANVYVEDGNIYTTTDELWGNLNILLDVDDEGDNQIAFALFDELANTIDLNGDGIATGNIGVLAYDDDGVGLTSLVFLVNSTGDFTYADFSETNIDAV